MFHYHAVLVQRPLQVMRSAEDDVQMLLPHVKEMEQFMHLFGREYITFDITLQRSQVIPSTLEQFIEANEIFETSRRIRIRIRIKWSSNSDGTVPQGEAFEVAASVQVKNERTRQACYISSFEFLEHRSIFQAEVN